ncbi:MAG TPA: hypothetical protein VK279_07550 [Solirubrobacteraceae bacterium]|nr:hypothetical protein [Solirubrobacteraceae bacterium]
MPGEPPPTSRYEVVVRGRLSERFGAQFEGVTLEQRPDGTALRAAFADQTQLFGLLDRLRDLGIELESVGRLV